MSQKIPMKFVGYAYQENYRYGTTDEWFWELESTNRKAAILELKEKIIGEREKGELTYDGGCTTRHGDFLVMDNVSLYEVTAKINMPIEHWYAERDRAEFESAKQKRKLKYEALKEEFDEN